VDYHRVDRIEQEWVAQGKQRDIDYVWLAHGKYIRDNSDFHMETPETEESPPPTGLRAARDIVSRFYNTYIGKKETIATAARCCITGGCRDGINAGLYYFNKEDDRNILYLVPTYQPLIDMGKSVFESSRIFFLKHFNEPWSETLQHIETACDRHRIGCIILTNPNNPAGIMYPDFFLAGLGKLSNKRKIWILEDGAYFLHYEKEGQTTVLDHCRYAVSCVTALKLLLGKHRVGGAVLTEALDPEKFSAFAGNVPSAHQRWFASLLKKVAFENPRLLKNQLAGMFDISEQVKRIFTENGFHPVYGAYRGASLETSIGPVITFGDTDRKGDPIPAATLFDLLTEHAVLTTPMDPGFRINSRGISETGVTLLRKKMSRIRAELENAVR
jgi:hypothetical protein